MNIAYLPSFQRTEFFKDETTAKELLGMGLVQDDLTDAISYGWSFRINNEKSLDVPLWGGTSQWAQTIYKLRLNMVSKGWKANDDKNLSKIVSPNKKIAIIVSSGDGGTGREGVPVKTKNQKGKLVDLIINNNLKSIRQISMFENSDEFLNKNICFDVKEIWYLLFFYDETKKEIRCELSLPIQVESNHQINKWAKRILLNSIDVTSGLSIDSKPEFNNDIDIEVTKKIN